MPILILKNFLFCVESQKPSSTIRVCNLICSHYKQEDKKFVFCSVVCMRKENCCHLVKLLSFIKANQLELIRGSVMMPKNLSVFLSLSDEIGEE